MDRYTAERILMLLDEHLERAWNEIESHHGDAESAQSAYGRRDGLAEAIADVCKLAGLPEDWLP